MIQRVNFLEKKRLQITYRLIVNIGGVVLGICAILYVYVAFNHFRLTKNIEGMQANIERLKKEKESLMKKEKKVEGTGPFVAIQDLLEKSPNWSSLMDTVSQILPHQVWLQELKSVTKTKDDIEKKEIHLKGQAKNAQAISAFLKTLEDTPFFENVVLKGSEENKTGLFQFEIQCDISSNFSG